MTAEKAALSEARFVSKEDLFRHSDILSVHIVLSNSTRGIVGEPDLDLMKTSAYFINTSRGPLVDEAALINALKNKKIAGAALDVYDTEPLPANHPFRCLPNVLATPHLGYGSKSLYEIFYGDSVENIRKWISENTLKTDHEGNHS